MEKMLSKSKSRFFGKKKSSKNLGISSSDLPATEPEKLVNEGYSEPSSRPTPPGTVPDSGASAVRSNGSPSHLRHAGSSHMGSARPVGLHDHANSTSSYSRPSPQGSVSQSQFQVHISPTTFSPIIIPSSTPQESVTTSPSKHRDISILGSKCGVANAEHTPRVGEEERFTHGRSQSSISPNETPTSRARSRRHAIPANFLESVGAASGGMKTFWNGQSLGAEQHVNSQSPKDRSPSSFPSQTALVHPSASAPVTSCLSNPEIGLISSELAPIYESRTDPAMNLTSSRSTGHTPLPRSIPSYNLAGITPSSSCSMDPRRAAEVGQRPSARCHRSALPIPPVSDAKHRPQRSSPQPVSSSSLARASEATITQHQSSNHHRMSPSVGSETEIGYKGLAFPLPPSSEEGLAMSYSSSQSSLFSAVSARRSGDQPVTPKTTRDGKLRGDHDHDSRPPGSTESRGAIPGSGRSARDRNVTISMSENRVSPTPNTRLVRRKLDDATEDFECSHTSGPNIDEGSDIRRQERAAKELEDVLGVRAQQDGPLDDTYLTARVRAVSEASRSHPAGARPQKQPEPTKPLVLNSSRKTLHTTRSFTTLTERKQLQPSSSSRDLAGAVNSVNGRGERVRTTTAIPVRIGPGVQRDRDAQAPVSVAPMQTHLPNEQSSIPPSYPLPTPPNSSSALSLLVDETKSTEDVASRTHADVEVPPAPPLTLEEVTEALRAQRARFDELSGYVLDAAQRHTAEKEAYVGRVGRLEGTVAKLEREIRGLRWLVLENTKARGGVVSDAGLILDATAEEQSSESKRHGENDKSSVSDRKLRRRSTMPQLPTLAENPGHERRKRFGGLGLEFSPESTGSSPITISSLATPSRFEVDIGDEEHTPSMDEIIDKLMAVRQWAGSDVRVSVIESVGRAGDSKRIVFRQV